MKKKKLFKIPDGEAQLQDERITIPLEGGGSATCPTMPTKDTINALNEMVKLAKKNCK